MPIYKKANRRRKASSYEVLNNNVDFGTRHIDHLPAPYFTSPPTAGGPYADRTGFSDRTRRACQTVAGTSFYLCACKTIFVGDVGTGKSSLVNRFCHEIFDGSYRGTVGVDFEVEKFHVLGHAFSLQIWDTAGHERFKGIGGQAYYRNANVVVVVFDMTRAESLLNARRWLDEAMRHNHPGTLRFLVGTKMDLLDLDSQREIEGDAAKMAQELQAEYWSVSAQTGENVTRFFQRLTALAFDNAVQRMMEPNNPVVHPSGNSLLNLYFLKKDENDKKLKKYSFCRIN